MQAICGLKISHDAICFNMTEIIDAWNAFWEINNRICTSGLFKVASIIFHVNYHIYDFVLSRWWNIVLICTYKHKIVKSDINLCWVNLLSYMICKTFMNYIERFFLKFSHVSTIWFLNKSQTIIHRMIAYTVILAIRRTSEKCLERKF